MNGSGQCLNELLARLRGGYVVVTSHVSIDLAFEIFVRFVKLLIPLDWQAVLDLVLTNHEQ